MKCLVTECERAKLAKGYCGLHYYRYHKYGNANKTQFDGRYKTPEYTAWAAMKQRCTNPNNPQYKNYGERGITVCAKWSESFDSFLADMGKRPANKSLDRINPMGNYEPDNCKWSDSSEQGHHKRARGKLGIRGVTAQRGKFIAQIKRSGIQQSKTFVNIKEAIDWYEAKSKEIYS